MPPVPVPKGEPALERQRTGVFDVTDYRDKEFDEWEKVDPEHGDWGPEITIIPAGEISEVRIRHAPSLLRRWRRGRGTGKGSGVVGDEDPSAD